MAESEEQRQSFICGGTGGGNLVISSRRELQPLWSVSLHVDA